MSVQLIKYEAARQALAEANAVDEVKALRDKAEAMRAYARQAKDFEMANWAAEIRIRAERKLGEMLKAQKEAGGMAKRGPDKATGQRSQRETSDTTPKLADMGISKSMSSRARRDSTLESNSVEQGKYCGSQKLYAGRTGQYPQSRRISRAYRVDVDSAPAPKAATGISKNWASRSIFTRYADQIQR